jgi:hypothetical protein
MESVGEEWGRMELDTVLVADELPLTKDAPVEAESRALIGVRRWLEDAWRHGEIIVDNDGLEVTAPAQQPNRFEISQRSAGAPEPGVM